MRILVVEDEPKVARLLERGLRQQSYAVDVAGDGDQALLMIRDHDYDLVILDVMLPGRDGFLDFPDGSRFPHPETGERCAVYDSERRSWRHMNFFQYARNPSPVPIAPGSDGRRRRVDDRWSTRSGGRASSCRQNRGSCGRCWKWASDVHRTR